MSNKNFLWILLLVLLGIGAVVALFVQGVQKNSYVQNTPLQNPLENLADQNVATTTEFNYDEVIKATIADTGGVVQNADKSVVITFPPLRKSQEFTVSFKKSAYAVKRGVGSPITISISPDVSLMASAIPIQIKVKYDSQYDLPQPYLVDTNNKLSLVDMGDFDRSNHYFTMFTFHGGDYSWIYITE